MDRHILSSTRDKSSFHTESAYRSVAPMPRPCEQRVCVADTSYYHVFSRCVRRAFLVRRRSSKRPELSPLRGDVISHRKRDIRNVFGKLIEVDQTHLVPVGCAIECYGCAARAST